VDEKGKEYWSIGGYTRSAMSPPDPVTSRSVWETAYPYTYDAKSDLYKVKYSFNLAKIVPASAGKVTLKAEIGVKDHVLIPISVVVRDGKKHTTANQ
jgi:hypothetical protein